MSAQAVEINQSGLFIDTDILDNVGMPVEDYNFKAFLAPSTYGVLDY